MTVQEKQNFYRPMLKDFETDMMKDWFMDMVADIPDYIFTIPASTTMKYHSQQQCVQHGQIIHEYLFFSIANHRLRLKHWKNVFDKPEVRDAIRCTAALHDAIKCGFKGSKHTVADHPKLAAEWVMTTETEHKIPTEIKEMIAGMCEAHSGEWNKSRSGKVIMKEPETEAEFFVHECDILSSRSDIIYDIPDELQGMLSIKNEWLEDDPSTFVMPFGKHKGELIVDIKNNDPDYFSWCINNLQDKSFYNLLTEI